MDALATALSEESMLQQEEMILDVEDWGTAGTPRNANLPSSPAIVTPHLPHYKDQVRPDKNIPLARRVNQLSNDKDSITLPAAVLQVLSESKVTHPQSQSLRDPTRPSAVGNNNRNNHISDGTELHDPDLLRKHIVWAVVLVVLIVAVAIVVSLIFADNSTADRPIPTAPTNEPLEDTNPRPVPATPTIEPLEGTDPPKLEPTTSPLEGTDPPKREPTTSPSTTAQVGITIGLPANKLVASDSTSKNYFGKSVDISGDTIVIGAPNCDTANGTDSGCAYVYTHSGIIWTEQAKLTARDGAPKDEFGWSVAISGHTIVIGAWADDNYSGGAYVYIRSGDGGWTEQTKLVASDGAADSEFGTSVAIDADTIVIGANMGGASSGKGFAYVFTKLGLEWTEQAKLAASDGAVGDRFGWSAAISGDIIVIGADQSDDSNMAVNGSGIAYVYFRLGDGGWTEQTKLINAAADVRFGSSVAIDADTIVIGENGSAFVYILAEGIWTEQAELRASDGYVDSGFGLSVAIYGGVIVVGAPGDVAASGIDSGSAYVNIRSGDRWTEQAKLTAFDGNSGDEIGSSVAIDEDTIVVGADGADTELGEDSGAAYIYLADNASNTV